MFKFVNVAGVAIGCLFIATPVFAEVGKTANFAAGNHVILVETINIRSKPNGPVVGKMRMGTLGTLVGVPSNAGGYTWWQVKYVNGMTGWSAEDFMQSPNVPIQVNPGVVAATAPRSRLSAQSASAAEVAPTLAQLMQELHQALKDLQSMSH